MMQEARGRVEIDERGSDESIGAEAGLENEGMDGFGLGNGEGCGAGSDGGDEGGFGREAAGVDQGLQRREERVEWVSAIGLLGRR